MGMRTQHTLCKHKYTIHTTHTRQKHSRTPFRELGCAQPLLLYSEGLWPPGSGSQQGPAGGNRPRRTLPSSLTALGASCCHIWVSRSEAVSAGKTRLLLLGPGLWPQPHPHPTWQEGGRQSQVEAGATPFHGVFQPKHGVAFVRC